MTRRDPATAAKRRARALPPGSLLEGLAPHLRRTVGVAGERLELQSNDERLLSLAEELFARYGPPLEEAREPLVLRVLLNEPEAPAPLYPRPLYRTQAHLFALALGPHDSGSADLHTGFAFAVVSPALLADRWRLQRQLLATLGLALLGVARGHVPLHCAALTRDGRSVLVHGPSGTGKSTLAYAAARRGYQVVSEDAVHVSGAREPRVWGVPWQFQLMPDAARFFPELEGLEPRLQPNGKLKLELDLEAMRPGSVAPSAPLGPSLLLQRRPGPTRVERLAYQAAAELVEPAWPWQVGWTAAHEQRLEALLRAGVYRFASGAAPEELVDALDAFWEEREAHGER